MTPPSARKHYEPEWGLGGGKLVLLEGGRLGGHAIHRWNRLVLYIMGKLVNKSVQQHRGHGRSFSISTNQKPVASIQPVLWLCHDCKLTTKLSRPIQFGF